MEQSLVVVSRNVLALAAIDWDSFCNRALSRKYSIGIIERSEHILSVHQQNHGVMHPTSQNDDKDVHVVLVLRYRHTYCVHPGQSHPWWAVQASRFDLATNLAPRLNFVHTIYC